MNGISEFFEVALAIFLGIPVLLFLLTYLERSLIEPAKEESPTVPDSVEVSTSWYRSWFHRRSRR
jgi:hypothetical protein